MNTKINKSHAQLPNGMGLNGLDPKDQLTYVVIRSYDKTGKMESFPSLQTLALKTGYSVPTIRSSIKRLVEKKYLSIRKDGRKNVYVFNKCVKYEPFSQEFIDNTEISSLAKSYIVASQQYMFKDAVGYGKISYTNAELAQKINMPESSISRCNRELENKGWLTIIHNVKRDIETGLCTTTKVFDMNEIGQAIIWTVSDHEERIQKLELQFNNALETKDRIIAERDAEIARLKTKYELSKGILTKEFKM